MGYGNITIIDKARPWRSSPSLMIPKHLELVFKLLLLCLASFAAGRSHESKSRMAARRRQMMIVASRSIYQRSHKKALARVASNNKSILS